MPDTEDEPTPPPRHGFDRMKVHVRRVPIRGTTYHVVTLRPGLDAKFSTNFYHNTWHILSDRCGCEILGRLMWGLAFQKQPNTLVLIAPPHLQPSPFDGAPSWPIVLAVKGNCPLNGKDLRELKARLDHLPETQTIRWLTHTVDPNRWPYKPWELSEPKCETFPRGGFICHTADSVEMKYHAWFIGRLKPSLSLGGEEWHFLPDCGAPDGEVQVFDDYRQRVSASVVARKRVLETLDRRVPPDELEELVSAERHRFRRNRGR